MSGQFSASLSFDDLPERISATPTAAPRGARPPADSLGISDAGTDRPRLEAAPLARAPRRWGGKLGLQVGILVHLVCVAFVGAATIVVFFGMAFSLLGDPAKETVVASGARDRQMAPIGAEPDIPQSAPTFAAGPSRSAPVTLADEPPSSAASVAPFPGDLPTAVATAPMATPAMTALAAPVAGSIQIPTSGTQPSQGLGSIEITETLGMHPEVNTGQNDKSSLLKPAANASTEIVRGMVTKAVDAMTWVVGDQIVNLWGIRPGPSNPSSSLIEFAGQVRAKGAVECRRQTHSNRYRCLMATGEDVGETALFAGLGRAADGATVAYRSAEAQAHQKSKGLWTKP
jgi:hypothetical protein